MRDGFVDTFSNNRIYFDNPDPSLIELIDIATGLSHQCRFAGQLADFYSVAQHSLILFELAPAHLEFEALFHDASEAYITDIPTPLKAELPKYKEIESRFMEAISKKIGFKFPLSEELEYMDKRLTLSEAVVFNRDISDWKMTQAGITPIDNFSIPVFYTPTRALQEFIYYAKTLLKKL